MWTKSQYQQAMEKVKKKVNIKMVIKNGKMGHFGPDWNILATAGWTAMKFGRDMLHNYLVILITFSTKCAFQFYNLVWPISFWKVLLFSEDRV